MYPEIYYRQVVKWYPPSHSPSSSFSAYTFNVDILVQTNWLLNLKKTCNKLSQSLKYIIQNRASWCGIIIHRSHTFSIYVCHFKPLFYVKNMLLFTLCMLLKIYEMYVNYMHKRRKQIRDYHKLKKKTNKQYKHKLKSTKLLTYIKYINYSIN